MTLRTVLALLTIHVAVLVSCSKDKSYEMGEAPDPNTGNPGTDSQYGWAYTGNSNNLRGCIDTAYKETNQAVTVLAIEGTDTANNAFLIAIGSPSGNIATGTYSEIQGAGMIVTDKEGKTYTSKEFTLTITSINNNEVSAEFSGSFTDDPTTNNTAYIVTGGKLKAVIGANTPCE